MKIDDTIQKDLFFPCRSYNRTEETYMKIKFTIISILLSFSLILLSACSQNESSASAYKVFEVKQQSYSNTVKLNHSFDLDHSFSLFNEDIANPVDTFSISNNSIALDYAHSRLNKQTGIKFRVYHVDDNALSEQQKQCMKRYLINDPTISFDSKTGNLFRIDYPFDTINVSTEMSNSEIRTQVEAYLKNVFNIDFTPYDQVDIKRSDTLDDPQATIAYWTLEWYRMEKGHKVLDSVQVTVLKDGFLSQLQLTPPLDITDPNLTQNLYQRGGDLENEIIDKKIQTIYNTNETRLVNWNSSEYDSKLYTKNGTWYVEYLVTVKYVEKATNTEWGEVCNIVVEIPKQ